MPTQALVRFRVRQDTAAGWSASNPVLVAGEPGLEIDTGKIKYGDGVRNWATLPYSSGVALASTTPPAAGTGSAGSSSLAARADHTHSLPSALSAQTVSTSGDVSVGGSLNVSGALVGGSHRHSPSEINDFSAAVFAQISASIKAGSNVTAAIDPVAKTITISSTAVGTTPLTISFDPADTSSTDGSALFVSKAIGGSGAISYQWQSSSDNGTTWLDVAGATGTSLALSGLSGSADGTKYRMKAMSGTETVYSLPATLRLPSITITAQPPDVSVVVGQLVSLSVAATAGSSAVSYQWQSRLSSSDEWLSVPEASQATYSFTPSAVIAGTQYRAVVSALGLVAYSRTATVVARALDLVFVTQPIDVQAVSNAAGFTASASGGTAPIAYRWQKASASGDFSDIADGASGASGQATESLSLTSLSSSDHLNRYRLKATDASGFVAYSAVGTLTTLTLLITAHPSDVSVASGATLSASAFSVTGTAGGTITYQWQRSTDAGATWSNISGATSSTYGSITVTSTSDGYLYRCGLTYSGQTLYSNAAALSVAPAALTISSQPSNATSSNRSATFSLTYSGGPSGNATVYWQWRLAGTGEDGWATAPSSTTTTSNTTVSYTFTGLVGAYDQSRVRGVVTKGAATAFTNAVTLTVPDVTITTHPSNVTTTTDTASLSFAYTSTSCASPDIAWQFKLPSATTWETVYGSSSSTLSLTGLTGQYGQYQYRASVTCGGATTYTNVATVTVAYPPLRITTQPLNVTTSTTTATLTFAHTGGDGSTAVIKWERQVAGLSGSTWTTIAGAVQTSLVISGLTAQLSGSQYRATVTVGSESVTTRSAVLTISGATITLNPADATAVNGSASFSFDFSSTACSSPSIAWERRSPSSTAWGPVQGGTGKLLSLTGLTSSNSGWLYRASVTCSDTTIYTSEATLIVPSYSFFLSQPASQSVAANATVTFSYQGVFSASAYPARWQMRRVGATDWAYYTQEGQSQQSISFTAVASLHHNTEWRVEITMPSDVLYSSTALLTVNKATSIKVVNVSGMADLIGIAYAKGAYLALSSEQTGIARRSTNGGDSWSISFLPASRYWDGIVATSQGALVAYSSGDSGTADYQAASAAAWGNPAKNAAWLVRTAPTPAVIARSFDGGLTWSTAPTPFFMGSRVRMWSFPWNNVLVATYRDETIPSLPAPAYPSASFPYTRFGRHYIAFNYNNGAPDAWYRYELPKFAGGGANIASSITDTACPDITSMAISPAGLLVCTSRYQGFTYQTGSNYPIPLGTIIGAYDRKGYVLYRNLASGLGAPVVADTATSGVSTGVPLRTITRTPVLGQWRPQ
jgi:hypothetical protein